MPLETPLKCDGVTLTCDRAPDRKIKVRSAHRRLIRILADYVVEVRIAKNRVQVIRWPPLERSEGGRSFEFGLRVSPGWLRFGTRHIRWAAKSPETKSRPGRNDIPTLERRASSICDHGGPLGATASRPVYHRIEMRHPAISRLMWTCAPFRPTVTFQGRLPGWKGC